MAKTKTNTVKIKLVRSLIGASEAQRKVVASLGLTKKDQGLLSIPKHLPLWVWLTKYHTFWKW